jgi:glycosyltransferase involved in cell wall biosynthesis
MKNKDYDFLLDIAKMTYSQRKDVTFIVVGEGPELERLKTRIKKEKITNMRLIGKRNDVELLVSTSDIGVLFTPSEGISNAIMEYMALGKPVSTTDICGGSNEIIANNESGYIVERNAQKVINNIFQLLDNEQLRLNMGAYGKFIINSKFNIAIMGNEFLKIYQSIKPKYQRN